MNGEGVPSAARPAPSTSAASAGRGASPGPWMSAAVATRTVAHGPSVTASTAPRMIATTVRRRRHQRLPGARGVGSVVTAVLAQRVTPRGVTTAESALAAPGQGARAIHPGGGRCGNCLLYTSDAADDLTRVD